MLVKREKLHQPNLVEMGIVLQNGLAKYFNLVKVEVAECPNLELEPFHLAAEGLGGSPRLADVGGVPYLLPLAQKDKVYDMRDVAQKVDLPDAFIIGAGAGPHRIVKKNSELIPNLKLGSREKNCTHCVKMNGDNFQMHQESYSEFSLLGNLFLSEGLKGPVLKVVAKNRKQDSTNFVSLLRQILSEQYGEQAVGVGGVFILKTGKAKTHVMPDFSEKPITSDDELNQWLRFFNMSAPLICLSTFISKDPGLDLRVEHTHCFSTHGEGGHYHCDVTPEDAEYEGYFNVAEYVYRVDPPEVTHGVGRD